MSSSTGGQLGLPFAPSVSRSRYQGADHEGGLTAISLFSSGGIGELGLTAAGFDILVANELLDNRCDLYEENFTETHLIRGDIWEVRDEVIETAIELLDGRRLDLVYATPPCQGMSTNGRGKLASEIENGRRRGEDPRNRLIIPTVDIILALNPMFVLFENVPGMVSTVIRNEHNGYESILEYVSRRLRDEYVGAGEIVACEDFGIPQLRRRLITIFSRNQDAQRYFAANGGSYLPHGQRIPGPTLEDAIGHFPELDAREGANADLEFHPQHRVPLMDGRKYWWVEHTPEGDTAFNNQCVNPGCGFDGTPGHKEEKRDGKWVAVAERPLRCLMCGELLPRPTVVNKDGSLRPLKGFHSAYRRMRYDDTARTLTQNFIYEASDNKIHPTQNRVLSVYEAMVIQTIDRYEYRFEIDGLDIGIPRIAEVIGESVPPLLIERIANHLAALASKSIELEQNGQSREIPSRVSRSMTSGEFS